MLITTGGVLIRTSVAEVRETGRSAQGVRLINLDAGEKLSGVVKIIEAEGGEDEDSELEDGELEAGEGGDGVAAADGADVTSDEA